MSLGQKRRVCPFWAFVYLFGSAASSFVLLHLLPRSSPQCFNLSPFFFTNSWSRSGIALQRLCGQLWPPKPQKPPGERSACEPPWLTGWPGRLAGWPAWPGLPPCPPSPPDATTGATGLSELGRRLDRKEAPATPQKAAPKANDRRLWSATTGASNRRSLRPNSEFAGCAGCEF